MTDGRTLDRALGSHVVIESGNIPDGIVIESDIGADSIGTSELKNDAVETANIKDANVTAGKLATDAVETAKIKDLNVTNGKLANSTIQSGKVSFFKSTEQTSTGSAQNVAHGLGRVPALVIIYVTELGAGLALDVAEGAHTTTNVVLTVSTGAKFRVVAF